MRYVVWDKYQKAFYDHQHRDPLKPGRFWHSETQAKLVFGHWWDDDRYEIVEWDDAEWRVKEREKYDEGTYIKPVWYKETWYILGNEKNGYYVSVNAEDHMKVDYYPSKEKAEKGISQQTTPGRFLKRFFGDKLTEEQIKRWADTHREEFANPPTLYWASTPEEIRKVYEMESPFSSCMQKERDCWADIQGAEAVRNGTVRHPTEAYGAGDLSIAYVMKGDRLMSRALVWRDKKKVGRVYGDVALLRSALKRSEDKIETLSDNSKYDDMEGARLLRIPLPDTRSARRKDEFPLSGGSPLLLLPYIDSYDTSGVLPIDDTYAKVVKTKLGQYKAYDQNGQIFPHAKCSCCDHYITYEKAVIAPGLTQNRRHYNDTDGYMGNVCEYCTATFKYCNVTHMYYHPDHYTHVEYYENDESIYSSKAVLEVTKDRIFKSDRSGKYYSMGYKTKVGEQYWTRHEALTHARMSEVDGCYYPIGDMLRRHNKWYTHAQYAALQDANFDLFPRMATA